MHDEEIRNPPVALAPALIVDDDPAVRTRMARLLGEVGVAAGDVTTAASVGDAQALLGTHRFAFALIDVGLPDGSGLDLLAWLRVCHPQTTAIIVSTFGTKEMIVAALHAGATGYLLKEREDAEIVASLRTVEHGGAPIDPFVATHILGLIAQAPVADAQAALAVESAMLSTPLTAREREILGWVAQGLITREIAAKIARSKQTVECHIKNIFRKLRVTTRAEAIHTAHSLGLLH